MYFLQRLISIWSTGDETSRVLAFLSIIKLTRQVQDSFLEVVIKVGHIYSCKDVNVGAIAVPANREIRPPHSLIKSVNHKKINHIILQLLNERKRSYTNTKLYVN